MAKGNAGDGWAGRRRRRVSLAQLFGQRAYCVCVCVCVEKKRKKKSVRAETEWAEGDSASFGQVGGGGGGGRGGGDVFPPRRLRDEMREDERGIRFGEFGAEARAGRLQKWAAFPTVAFQFRPAAH